MLSNYVIISENNYSKAEDNQNKDSYIPSSQLKGLTYPIINVGIIIKLKKFQI